MAAERKLSNISKAYLAFYNIFNFFGWFAVLIFHNYSTLKAFQCFAILDIFNAIYLLKTPVITTILQIASRLFVVLLILPIESVFCWWMINAWGITEVVRSAFYFLVVLERKFYFVSWLRYSLFLILYPIGAGSEAALVYLKSKSSSKSAYFYYLVLAIYPFGFYSLFAYMLSQRKKVLKKE